ncbi:TetR family transcriptional regulator [Actinomycetospora sp. NBRC 106378]|uniref:TetR/AcrR family transcriptional regulator n=1 Tax=Actinomycetospora sp. NBRC 106378 TaxID=3032208 RepID=UPI0024A3A140|nr:TetR family transcriptional regulator [Actinomycetospora sp. NBRC 106378]GLZ51373.1 TetR family transcriptional regulator [Actinomycetospora sp. NBRC 106378]
MTKDVLWLRDQPAASARRAEPLSVERIVTAAVAELDEHGAERLTMRRLAQRLDVTSTALYWHVRTKEDVLDLAVDHVLGEVPVPSGGEPRAAARALLVDWRSAMLRHPWSSALLGRPLLGPNVLARIEFLQATLVRAGLSGVDLQVATKLLSNVVIGTAMNDSSWRRLDDPAVMVQVRQFIAGRADLYPTLGSSGFLDEGSSDDELFERGLDRVLDAVGLSSPA